VRYKIPFVLMAALLALASVAPAQDFGVAESAETIDRGNFKIRANPMLIFAEEDFLDDEFGLSASAGYGFTDKLDAEAKLAFYDGVTLVGADVEFWLMKGDLDVSLSVGGHLGMADDEGVDTKGLDLTGIVSTQVAEKLEVYGALDLAMVSLDDVVGDDSFTTLHLVPGIEYKLAEDLDLVAEFGLGLNDDSSNYVSGGLAYYLR
jgi:hypothetical protein